MGKLLKIYEWGTLCPLSHGGADGLTDDDTQSETQEEELTSILRAVARLFGMGAL
uniref:Uncharacterized protein n=1 Tax=Anguilla anguilla TaxID=7936 RepID=A0A0E9U699_ANGAN